MSLELLWFALIGVLWTGFFVLEGFDFGVGMLLPVLGRSTERIDAVEAGQRRRLLLTTIGPHWDGNEVWLVTAAGATFAAFPGWYATMFSGFYLPMLLVVISLIVRAVGLEYRAKRDDPAWRQWCDRGIVVGSVVPPFLLGLVLVDLVSGIPLDARHDFTGSPIDLFQPLGVVGGLAVVALCLAHGAGFLALKTSGPVRADAARMATRVGVAAALLPTVALALLNLTAGSAASWLVSVLSVAGALIALRCHRIGRQGWAFVGSAVALAATVAALFLMLYPDVVVSSAGPGTSLTIAEAASSHLTLQIMTGAAAVFTPVMLLYTGWTYWVFRRRIGTAQLADATTH